MLLAEAADSRQRLGGGNYALAENPGLVAGKVEDGRSNAGKLARVDQRTARGANLLRNVREPARVGAAVAVRARGEDRADLAEHLCSRRGELRHADADRLRAVAGEPRVAASRIRKHECVGAGEQ